MFVFKIKCALLKGLMRIPTFHSSCSQVVCRERVEGVVVSLQQMYKSIQGLDLETLREDLDGGMSFSFSYMQQLHCCTILHELADLTLFLPIWSLAVRHIFCQQMPTPID